VDTAADITIRCSLEGGPADLTFEFGHTDGSQVTTRIVVSLPGGYASLNCYLLGYDLSRFAEDLSRLYETLDGRAVLTSFDENVRIVAEVADRARGRIALGGKVRRLGCSADTAHEFDPVFEVAFAGLTTDQSYLPPVLTTLRRFLDSSGVILGSPWTPG